MTSKPGEHREIIDRHAARGWRYADHIGQYARLDLIFEKDAEE